MRSMTSCASELPRKPLCLSDLETGMGLSDGAAKQNRILLEHIQGHALYRSFDEIEREQFDDAMIEAHQLVSMRPNLRFYSSFQPLTTIF